MTTGKKSRKQDILDAALHCFIEYGVEATTIDMIRERSAASVGSLYHHFGSKESIAVTLYANAMSNYHDALQSLLATADSAEAGIKSIVHAYVDWIAANPETARFVLYNRSAVAKSDAAEGLAAQTRAHLANVLRWLEPHIDSGRLKKLPSECYSSLLTGPAHDYARLWLSGRAKTNIRNYREIFAEAAWNAVKP